MDNKENITINKNFKINKNELYYLYSDGSRFPKINKSGFGGCIKDKNDNIIAEFGEEIKDNDQKNNYELWGLINGLQLAIDLGITQLMSRGDDKTLMTHMNECIHEAQNIRNVLGNKTALVENALNLSKNFDDIHFEYIPRELNKYSDILSRKYTKEIEENYINDYNILFNKSINYFENKIVPPHSIYFYNKKLLEAPQEFNPFMLSRSRNKHQKAFLKDIEANFKTNWELAPIYRKNMLNDFELDCVILRKFNQEKVEWNEIQRYSIDEPLNLTASVDVLNIALDRIYQEDKSPWLSIEIESLSDVFYRRKPLSKEIFPKFLEISNKVDKFDQVLFHKKPRKIFIKLKDKNKPEQLDIQKTVKLINDSNNISTFHKYLGILINLKIKEQNLVNLTKEEKDKLKEEIISNYKIIRPSKKLPKGNSPN